ncbi:outer membrane beta-barrel family protein [Flavobacterium cupriresistens]|uniref:outer membrane beta-barrel family protein n=1 Tax=Flavobacterium cupriresistens TaxID=2893885 RepID=UPI001E393DB4|nr:outer membrane beta-barrel family protein [Flavobacterium sp. F-323]UFH44604.1 outer membrane beta-barrel family protein [Flavobacterium sp. F-323]
MAGAGNLLSNVYSTYELTEPYHYDAYNFDYLFEIDSAGKKITADARYVSYRNYSDALMTADHYGAAGESLFTNVIRTHQPGSIKIKSVQADAELPFDEINLKTGFKFAEVCNDNNFHSEKLDQDQYIEIEDMTDHFQYSEKIIAGYISGSKSIAKISFDLGFRIEHTISEIDLANAMVNRSNNYTSFFPNFSASHQFQDDSRINIAVSKRINRPAYSGLNPVRWYNDEYFYFYGNPDLVPETARLFTTSYVLSNKYIFNMEYSKSSNYISRRLSYDPNGVTIRSQSANFRNYDRFDFNTVTPLKISDSWGLQVLTGVNYIFYPISEADYQSNLQQWAWNLSLQQQVKFLEHYSADISIKYTSSELYGVYVTGDVFFIDFGVKRTLIKGLDAVIAVNDVFNSYREIGYSNSRLTNYYYNEKPDSRRVSLTLRYNFGGELVNSGKKKTEEQQRL